MRVLALAVGMWNTAAAVLCGFIHDPVMMLGSLVAAAIGFGGYLFLKDMDLD
jgi:uncharacterized membrane protein YoaK (UPF0700 family)